MPKCVNLTKYFRERSRLQSSFKSNSLRDPLIHLRNYASAAGGGGGRPARNPGRPPTLPPPYPRGLIIGVCGRRHPNRTIFVISQIHIDEIAAVANAVFHADPDLQEELKEKCPYLFYEEFNNDFRELKAWAVTEHTGWVEKYGIKRLKKTRSYCYVFTPQWLEANLSYKTTSIFCYIDESSEANNLLEKARAEGFVPLFHWQSRSHIDVEPRITPLMLPDGYLLDNRDPPRRMNGANVIGKCVSSLLDVKREPVRFKENPYVEYLADVPLPHRLRL